MKPFERADREGWWIRFAEAGGRWVTRKGGNSEGEAWAALEREQLRVKAIRQGLVNADDAEAVRLSRRPLKEVLTEYRAYLEGNGRSPAHVAGVVRAVELVAEGIKAKCLADVKVRPVDRWLGDLVGRGRSARTRNYYLKAVKALLNWAVKRGMMRDNPLRVIDLMSEDADRREESRALTPDEFKRLLDATPNEERRLFYLMLGRTGLRCQELGRLRWQDMDLERGWLFLEAKRTKSRRPDELPLAADVLVLLRALPKSMGPVFKAVPRLRTLKADLARAGIDYETDRGQVDRKSLRKMFCTHLALAHVEVQRAAKLMRHKDPRLTLKVYTDPYLLDLKGAVDGLAGLAKGGGQEGNKKAAKS